MSRYGTIRQIKDTFWSERFAGARAAVYAATITSTAKRTGDVWVTHGRVAVRPIANSDRL